MVKGEINMVGSMTISMIIGIIQTGINYCQHSLISSLDFAGP